MLDRLVNWAETNQALLWWVGSASALALVVTLIAVVVIVIRMPPDYFADRGHHRMTLFRSHPALALAVSIARNTLGVVFLAAGIAMLVLPGQGLLTIFVALVALTLVTVAAAQVSFGAWEVWVSLGIASVKASLVAFYFMHLRYDKPFNCIVFLSSLAFVGLFLALTLMDVQI